MDALPIYPDQHPTRTAVAAGAAGPDFSRPVLIDGRSVGAASGERVRVGVRESTRLSCPHCDAPSLIRSSHQMTRLTRETYYACTNPECGHTFVALTEVVRTLSPSATPNPSVLLPFSSHVRRDVLRNQLEHAGSAEHQPRFTKPVTQDLFAAMAGGGRPPD